MRNRASSLRLSTLVLVASACLGPGSGRGEGTAPRTTDLLAERVAWSSWAPRPEIAPRSASTPEGGAPVLTLAGGGKAEVCGCWRRPLPTLAKGRRYVIEVGFQADKVTMPAKSVWAILCRGNSEFLELGFRGASEGRRRMSLELEPDDDWS